MWPVLLYSQLQYFNITCTDRYSGQPPQYSLDYGDWRPASTSNSTVMLYGLSDDSHSLQLKNVFNYEDAEGSGQDSAESAT